MCSVCLFSVAKHVFTFENNVPIGQYEFPFTIRLPNHLPTSFKVRFNNDEVYQIQYTIKAYFDS